MDSQSSSSSTGHGHGNGGAPASSTSVAGGGGGGGGVTHQLPQRDLSSVLAHIEVLQKQLAEKSAEINEVKMREESARQQVAQLNELNAKLSEAKREAMREDFNNKVRGWIQDLDPKQVPDGIKEEFLSGVEKFVDKGNETGAWKVARFPLVSFPARSAVINRCRRPPPPRRWCAARRPCIRTRSTRSSA